jgi:hypothetical protein
VRVLATKYFEQSQVRYSTQKIILITILDLEQSDAPISEKPRKVTNIGITNISNAIYWLRFFCSKEHQTDEKDLN